VPGRPDRGRFGEKRAAARDPSSAAPHLALGLLYERLERPSDAARELELAARLDPQSPEALNSLGGVLESAGAPKRRPRRMTGRSLWRPTSLPRCRAAPGCELPSRQS